MNITLKKVYTVSKKAERPRLFLQHLVCEAAGFQPGDTLYISMDEENEEIVLQNRPIENCVHTVHVSSRVSKSSQKSRPLVDTAGDRFASIISIKQKVEMIVLKKGTLSRIVVRPLQYKLKETETIQTQKDERLRLLSVCAGAGIGTSFFHETGSFTSVQEMEYKDDCGEVIKYNYPNSLLFLGDISDCHSVVQADVALVSLPCNQDSSLGAQEQGAFDNNLILATKKIIESSKAKVLLFENVPQFFNSKRFYLLKELLQNQFPYWVEKNVNSHDYGSIALRNRTFALAFQDKEQFLSFEFPQPPKKKSQKKLKDFLDSKHVEHEWKDLNKWKDNFYTRDSAWSSRSIDLTFVTGEAKKIQNIAMRYRSYCSSNSYVKSDCGNYWRFLTISELRRIFSIPDWFEFPLHIAPTRIYEMIGQSICGRVLKGIANEIAISFARVVNNLERKEIASKALVNHAISMRDNGQLELCF